MKYSMASMDWVGGGDSAAPESILDEAKRITSHDRNKSYGPPEDNFNRIALLQAAWKICRYGSPETIAETVRLLKDLYAIIANGHDARDVAMDAIMVKVAREANAPKRDNWVDIAGYARCGARIDGFESMGDKNAKDASVSGGPPVTQNPHAAQASGGEAEIDDVKAIGCC